MQGRLRLDLLVWLVLQEEAISFCKNQRGAIIMNFFFPTHFSPELSTAICSRSFVGTALPWRTLKQQEICPMLQPALSGATRADAGQAWAEGSALKDLPGGASSLGCGCEVSEEGAGGSSPPLPWSLHLQMPGCRCKPGSRKCMHSLCTCKRNEAYSFANLPHNEKHML